VNRSTADTFLNHVNKHQPHGQARAPAAAAQPCAPRQSRSKCAMQLRISAESSRARVARARCPQANKKCTAEPIFVVDGVTFCHIQTSKMFFVLTTVKNMQ
jgi:hypothetical protein